MRQLTRQVIAFRERLLLHLPLEERGGPQKQLHVLLPEPVDHGFKIRQALGVDLEVVIAEPPGTPRTVDPIHAVGNPEGAHHQYVFHEFGVERTGDGRAVVVSGPLSVLVAPAPREIHPFRRQERRPGIERVRANQSRRIGRRVELHFERRPLEFDPDARGIGGAEIDQTRPCALDEHGIAARRKVEGRVQGSSRLEDDVDLLTPKVEDVVLAGFPGQLLRTVDHPLHDASEVLLRAGFDRESPLRHPLGRPRRQADREIVAIALGREPDQASVGQPGFAFDAKFG